MHKYIILKMVLLATLSCNSVYGTHSCDLKSDSPTGEITAPPELITVGQDKIIGTKVKISLKATLKDKDIHNEDATSAGIEVEDTFHNENAIEWSEENNKGTFSDKTKKYTDYTTPNESGDYTIILKIKDDGTHAQDFTSLTEVNRLKIKVVNPDGVKIISQNVTIQNGIMTCPVVWQVTYQGRNLSWVGKLAEKIKVSDTFNGICALPYSYNSNGREMFPNWGTLGDFGFDTHADGSLTDNHDNAIPVNVNNGQYYDISARQEIAYKDSNGKFTSIGTFKCKRYYKMDNGVNTPVHDEAP